MVYINANATGVYTMTDATYNGWTNKETWLVNLWYGDALPEYFLDCQCREEIDALELREHVQDIAELSAPELPAGLLSDFINTCFSDVDWHQLAESITDAMQDLREH